MRGKSLHNVWCSCYLIALFQTEAHYSFNWHNHAVFGLTQLQCIVLSAWVSARLYSASPEGKSDYTFTWIRFNRPSITQALLQNYSPLSKVLRQHFLREGIVRISPLYVCWQKEKKCMVRLKRGRWGYHTGYTFFMRRNPFKEDSLCHVTRCPPSCRCPSVYCMFNL